jgi:6-methylsalicylate decarboxylase
MDRRHALFGAPHATTPDRRAILTGAAGLLLASGLPGRSHAATPAIDIHHHFAPPFYQEKAARWYGETGASADAFLAWTPEQMFDGLDRGGGVRAVLSVSAPGTAHLPTVAEAVDMARRCNDYAAELVAKRPNQLAFFVTVPMPHVKESIAEIDRAMALRGAVGVGLLTSYDTRYLGHPAFDPLMQHMHDRELPVFVHPTIGPCCVGLTNAASGVLIEFPVDTGRAIGNLVWSGALARYPGVKFVFSHGGGVTAMLTERLQMAAFGMPNAKELAPGGVDAMLRRIWVDTASATHPAAIAAARLQFGDDRVLFGTDAPWGTPERALASLDRLKLEPAVLDQIRHGNARKLIKVFG